jgi:hypothetical protein
VAIYYGILLLFLLLAMAGMYVSREVDRFLIAANGRERLHIRRRHLRKRILLKQQIGASSPFTAIVPFFKLGLLKFQATRGLLNRITSKSLGRLVRRAYTDGLKSRLVRRRLRSYLYDRWGERAVQPGLDILHRWSRRSAYYLVSPLRPMMFGMGVCLERRRGTPGLRLMFGMEVWFLFLYHLGRRRRRQWRYSPARLLAWCCRHAVFESVAHEHVHALQELNGDSLKNEYSNMTTIEEWFRCECDAHWYGSPMWVFVVLTFVCCPPVVMMAGWL